MVTRVLIGGVAPGLKTPTFVSTNAQCRVDCATTFLARNHLCSDFLDVPVNIAVSGWPTLQPVLTSLLIRVGGVPQWLLI